MDQDTLRLIQAITMLVGPLITALAKWLVPTLPKSLRPLLAVAATALAAGAGPADASLPVALGLGVASVGLRDLFDRALIAAGTRPEKARVQTFTPLRWR